MSEDKETNIRVPKSWLVRLREISTQEFHDEKLRLSMLVGYISSVDTLIKHNEIKEDVWKE